MFKIWCQHLVLLAYDTSATIQIYLSIRKASYVLIKSLDKTKNSYEIATLVVPIYSSTHQNFRLTLEKKAWNIIYCSTFTGGNQNQIHLSFLCLQIFRISCMIDEMVFLLTLFAMRGDTFHSLSFLDQRWSDEF